MQTTVKTNAAIKRALDNTRITKIKIEGHDLFLRPNKDRKTASWYIGFYSKGLKQKAFGKYPNLSLEEAIALKVGLMLKMLAEGSFVATRFKTMNELFDWFKLNMGKKEKKRKQNILNAINRHLKPSLGNLLISEFSRVHVDSFFREKEDRYKISTLSKMVSVLKQMLWKAMHLEIIETNVLAGTKITMFTESKIEPRDGRLEWRHIPKACKSINECNFVPAKIFNLLLLMHGSRLSETRKLNWEEIDFINKEIILKSKDVKNRKRHTLPMTEQAYEALLWYKNWQKKRYQGEYVFNGSKGGYISRSTAEKYIKRVVPKGDKWTSHDYRKLFADGIIRLRVDKFIAERILNHSESALERAYPAKELADRMSEALVLWHKYLSDYYPFEQHKDKKNKKKINAAEPIYIAA